MYMSVCVCVYARRHMHRQMRASAPGQDATNANICTRVQERKKEGKKEEQRMNMEQI
jgi:hypothetical protein